MGTRGLVGFRSHQQGLRGTYNHWDSYPNGLGQDIINFIRENYDRLPELEEKLNELQFVNEHRDKPSPSDLRYYQRYLDVGVGSPTDSGTPSWYQLLRQTQGVASLSEVLNGNLHHWIEGTEFLLDSLFCEYAYVLNFNLKSNSNPHGCLEVWEGFQKKVVREDGIIPNIANPATRDYAYGACRLIAVIPFERIANDEFWTDHLSWGPTMFKDYEEG